MRKRTSRGLRRIQFIRQALTSQSSLIFRPMTKDVASPKDWKLHCSQDEIHVPGHGMCRVWWVSSADESEPRTPATDRAIVILFPGRRSNISYELPVMRFLTNLSVDVLAIDYPGFGPSDGRASETACYAAAEAAWEHLVGGRKYRPSNVILYGRSLGAAVATWLAARTDCGGLVFHGGFSSLTDVVSLHLPKWVVRLFCRTSLDARRCMVDCRCPLLMLHAIHDEVIPFEIAESTYESASVPRKMIRLDGGHYDTCWQSEPSVIQAWRELIQGTAVEWLPESTIADAQEGRRLGAAE